MSSLCKNAIKLTNIFFREQTHFAILCHILKIGQIRLGTVMVIEVSREKKERNTGAEVEG